MLYSNEFRQAASKSAPRHDPRSTGLNLVSLETREACEVGAQCESSGTRAFGYLFYYTLVLQVL